MTFWIIGGQVSFLILIVFFFMFLFYSLLEKERRAFLRSSFCFLLLVCLNLTFYLTTSPLKDVLFGAVFILSVLSFVIFFASPLEKKPIEIEAVQKRVDERDVIFSRFDYEDGSEIYREYYKRRPEYKMKDDEIRKLPDLNSAHHIKKNPLLLSLSDEEFRFVEHQLSIVSGDINTDKFERSPSENTRMIKKITLYLGAEMCGISLLDQVYVYSNIGRGPEPYGQSIELKHRYAISFAVEMDLGMIAVAPRAPVIVETAKKYAEAARISIILAGFIRSLGYNARAHIAGSNYQAVLPPLAAQAGLGELGRLGILITDRFGPRVRLGLVTTDLPLITDKPKIFGVQNFCVKCRKCAQNCPSQAIPSDEKVNENGVIKWVLNREECYRFWRKAGTDCSVCVYVCPYSKANNAFHSLIRKMTERSSIFQFLSVLGDDFFYGKFPKRRKKSALDIG